MMLPGRAFPSLLLVAASVAAALLVAEVAVRLWGLEGRAQARVVPGKGITFEPGSAYRHVKEGFSQGRFNRQGFRDYERTISKPPGVYRILVLGDSFVEALQVPLDAAFPAALERRLRDRPGGAATEVLAMGQSGFGTASELMRYLDFGAAYAPDLVLLAFYAGNDVRDNSRFLSGGAPAFYFTLDSAGRLQLDRTGIDALERARATRTFGDWLRRESQLAAVVSRRLYLLRQSRRASRRDAFPPSAPDLRDDANVYREDAGEAWREAWAVTGAILARLARETAARGSRLAIVSIPAAEQIEDDPAGATLAADPERDRDRPDRRLEAMAAENGVPCLLLAPGLRKFAAAAGSGLYGFHGGRGGHWNERGHAAAAALIADFLVERGLLPPKGAAASSPAERAFTAPSRGR